VTFSGEPGLDMGGLTKEWFMLLIRDIFRPEYGELDVDMGGLNKDYRLCPTIHLYYGGPSHNSLR
jgi:hypothetical protein